MNPYLDEPETPTSTTSPEPCASPTPSSEAPEEPDKPGSSYRKFVNSEFAARRREIAATVARVEKLERTFSTLADILERRAETRHNTASLAEKELSK